MPDIDLPSPKENWAARQALIDVLFKDAEALGQPLRPAEKLFKGLTVPAVEELKRLPHEHLHELYRVLVRASGSHCPVCHPEMAWMPDAARINGREYQRRQRARLRRRRKG